MGCSGNFVYYFVAVCESKRILKIGQYLAKLRQKLGDDVFYQRRVFYRPCRDVY